MRVEIFSWSYFFISILPGYHFSNKIRGLFIGLFLKHKGANLILNREVIIEVPHNITLGNNVGINARCWISGGGLLDIGDNVLIGPNVTIVTSNHNYSNLNSPIQEQGDTADAVSIGSNSWIGSAVVILPGVQIGANSIIGAGSIVTKSLSGNAVYAGNPAKKIKDR